MANDASKGPFTNYVLRVLKTHPKEASTVVALLLERYPNLDEERAGEIIWGLIDSRAIRVNDQAELELADAVAS